MTVDESRSEPGTGDGDIVDVSDAAVAAAQAGEGPADGPEVASPEDVSPDVDMAPAVAGIEATSDPAEAHAEQKPLGGDQPLGEDEPLGEDLPLADEAIAPERLRGAIEAILLVVDEPVSVARLAAGLGAPVADVTATLGELRDAWSAASSGIALREVAGGWRLYTADEFADIVGAFLLEGQTARLSQAALETLAVIAYRQPVTRARVSAVRGVNVDGVVRTLVVRGLVEERGSEESTGALLYGTTRLFLEKLGLTDLTELPPLAPLLPELGGLDDLELPPVRAAKAADTAAAAPGDVPADAPAVREGSDGGA